MTGDENSVLVLQRNMSPLIHDPLVHFKLLHGIYHNNYLSLKSSASYLLSKSLSQQIFSRKSLLRIYGKKVFPGISY